MTLHLIKLCVGAQSIESMKTWSTERAEAGMSGPYGRANVHVTRMFPKRGDEILGGGSLYWVLKGTVLIRQRIKALEPVQEADGVTRCAIVLDPEIVATQAQPRRAFQGWRYLKPEDAPFDLDKKAASENAAELRVKLAALGLL